MVRLFTSLVENGSIIYIMLKVATYQEYLY